MLLFSNIAHFFSFFILVQIFVIFSNSIIKSISKIMGFSKIILIIIFFFRPNYWFLSLLFFLLLLFQLFQIHRFYSIQLLKQRISEFFFTSRNSKDCPSWIEIFLEKLCFSWGIMFGSLCQIRKIYLLPASILGSLWNHQFFIFWFGVQIG